MQKETISIESDDEGKDSSSSFTIDENIEMELELQEQKWGNVVDEGRPSMADAAKMESLAKKFRDLKHSKEKRNHAIKNL